RRGRPGGPPAGYRDPLPERGRGDRNDRDDAGHAQPAPPGGGRAPRPRPGRGGRLRPSDVATPAAPAAGSDPGVGPPDAPADLPASFRPWIGREGAPVTTRIEPGAVVRFAEAVGDLNPLYVDPRPGRPPRHGAQIAPPTFLCALPYDCPYLPIPRGMRVLNVANSFTLGRPVRVGERVTTRAALQTVRSRGDLAVLDLACAYAGRDGDRLAARPLAPRSAPAGAGAGGAGQRGGPAGRGRAPRRRRRRRGGRGRAPAGAVRRLVPTGRGRRRARRDPAPAGHAPRDQRAARAVR